MYLETPEANDDRQFADYKDLIIGEDLYYLVPKHLMDNLMSELGSYAYINNCFVEMNGLNQQLTSTPLINLSEAAIEQQAIDIASECDYIKEGIKLALNRIKNH